MDEEVRGMMEQILQKVSVIDDRTRILQEDVAVLKSDVAVLKSDVAELKGDVAGLKGRMDRVEDRLDELGENVKNVQLALENEVYFSIRAIGEGHADIMYKLDDLIKYQGKNETMQLRTLKLEADMRDQRTDIDVLKNRVEKLGRFYEKIVAANPELAV